MWAPVEFWVGLMDLEKKHNGVCLSSKVNEVNCRPKSASEVGEGCISDSQKSDNVVVFQQ